MWLYAQRMTEAKAVRPKWASTLMWAVVLVPVGIVLVIIASAAGGSLSAIAILGTGSLIAGIVFAIMGLFRFLGSRTS